MCPKPHTQRGSALVVAVFIIIVMLALVLSLSRLLISSSESVVYEVQGTRALFAAQSGLELSLTKLFPIDLLEVAECLETRNVDFKDVNGLNGCAGTINCGSYTTSEPNPTVLYRLTSTASCEAGGFVASRTVQIEVR